MDPPVFHSQAMASSEMSASRISRNMLNRSQKQTQPVACSILIRPLNGSFTVWVVLPSCMSQTVAKSPLLGQEDSATGSDHSQCRIYFSS